MSLAHYTSAQIDQHMRGQAWSIRSFGIEHAEEDRRWRHVTSAWTVWIADHRRHIYEVAQWSSGAVYKTHTIAIAPDGALSCTCPAGRRGFARTVRGYCIHVNRLMIHALRRLPTLPAPAAEWARLPIATLTDTRRADLPCAPHADQGAEVSRRPPTAAARPSRSSLRFTPHTTTVMWMP